MDACSCFVDASVESLEGKSICIYWVYWQVQLWNLLFPLDCNLMLKDNNLLLWFATFSLIAVVSCGVGIGGELIEENNTKSKDSFENKTTYKKKKWFNSPSGFNKRNSSSAKTK